MRADLTALADGLADIVKEYTAAQVAPLLVRIKELESREIPAPVKGEKGDPGERGERGLPGEKGADGKDADQEAILKTLMGKVSEVLDEIPIPKDGAPGRDGIDGKDGKDGAPGEKGADGRDGVDGKDGLPGRDGVDGHQGEKGLDGRDGRDGKDGRDGQDGRDAASIEPIAEIDLSKSYPKGIWAKHAGGLWVSRTITDGLVGWDCIVEGFPEFKFEPSEDPRELKLSWTTSSGKTGMLVKRVPMVIDRGVFRDGNYEEGDGVTFGGSYWIAKKSTTERPTYGASDWRLAVKKGRDAT